MSNEGEYNPDKEFTKHELALEVLKLVNNFKSDNYELSEDDKLAVLAKLVSKNLDNR